MSRFFLTLWLGLGCATASVVDTKQQPLPKQGCPDSPEPALRRFVGLDAVACDDRDCLVRAMRTGTPAFMVEPRPCDAGPCGVAWGFDGHASVFGAYQRLGIGGRARMAVFLCGAEASGPDLFETCNENRLPSPAGQLADGPDAEAPMPPAAGQVWFSCSAKPPR